MHKIFVQRKKAILNFQTQRPLASAVLPLHFKRTQLGGVDCLYADNGTAQHARGEYGFEITTLVLTTLLAPVTVEGDQFIKGERYTEDFVELYLMNLAPLGATGVRTPDKWHSCVSEIEGGAFTYMGKWGCPIVISRPPHNQMIIHYLSGVYQYGFDSNNLALTTTFDHYLIQMVLPNQTLCYFAVPNTPQGETRILEIQQQIDNANPNEPLWVGAESPMLFYDDLQMWIFDDAKFVF